MKIITGCSNSVNNPVQNSVEAPFHLMLIHDGVVALAEAHRLTERLLMRTIAGFDVHRDELYFSDLAHPEIRKEAAELAAGCDLFIFATVDEFRLPNEVVTWLHLCFESRQEKESALVCLVGSVEEAMLGSPVHVYLQDLTDHHNVAFFSSAFRIRAKVVKTNIEEFEDTSLIRQVQTRSFPRPEGWGINE